MARIVLLFVALASASLAASARPVAAGADGTTIREFVLAQAAQPEAGVPAAERPAAESHEGAEAEGEHEESIWGPISRLTNFLVLAGVLYYFGRQPIAEYLTSRRTQIRTDLVKAEEMKREAAVQLADLQRQMSALPDELDTLKKRGHEDIVAEEARIEQAAAAERTRLLEQTRAEINHQLRLAHRELVDHASNLAVALATDRIKQTITPEDQSRLVDRYLQQVKG